MVLNSSAYLEVTNTRPEVYASRWLLPSDRFALSPLGLSVEVGALGIIDLPLELVFGVLERRRKKYRNIISA